VSLALSEVSRRGSPPPSAASHRSLLRVAAWRSTSVSAYATAAPSGDSCGSASRLSFIISVAVKGVAASAG